MGTVAEIAFTPPTAGKVIITANYECQNLGGGADWGASARSILFLIQSGSSGSPAARMSNSRIAQTMQYTFSVAAGVPCWARLDGSGNGAGGVARYWNVTLTVEFIKK